MNTWANDTAGPDPQENFVKIYFAGSIRAGRDDVSTYRALIDHLKQYCDVLTEHIGEYSLSPDGQSHLTDTFIHDRDLEWLRASDLVVAEVSTPSLGVGYEIATAVHEEIPVVALYRGNGGSLSAMIAGSPGVETFHYTELSQALAVFDAKLPMATR
jgi:2'-deoxynucleoside 5'-phosphate N-hydrolase